MALTQCPKCGNVYEGKDRDGITDAECPKCKMFASPSQTEYNVTPLLNGTPAEKLPGHGGTPPMGTGRLVFHFTGNGTEYFKIWIANIFLTVITCGIYSAWAKVRTRKYFYSNTRLAGGTFDYDGPPWAILRGRIIVGAIFMLFAVSGQFRVFWLYYLLMGIFLVTLPFLIYKSLRFNLHHTLFRNIRFRFLGSLKDSYIINLGFLLLLPFTIGIILPYTEYRRKRYYFGNIAYGSGLSEYRGKPGRFYGYYLAAGVILAVFMFIFSMLMATMVIDWRGLKSGGAAVNANKMMVIIFGMYAIFFILFYVTKTFLFVKLTNYSFEHTGFGNVTVTSTLRFWRLFFITITNMLAVVFSAGLLYPWTKVRYARYCFDRISVTAPDGLNAFTAAQEPEDSAVGDAAAEFFDFELGL